MDRQNDMHRTISENEKMAASYMLFYMQARLALRKHSVPLPYIFNNNPLLAHATAKEKSDAHLAINALVEHKIFTQDEAGLCISNLGQIFYEYVSGSNAESLELEKVVNDNADLVEIFNEISIDSRFTPPRLPVEKEPKHTPSFWNVWTVLLVIMVSLGIFKVFSSLF